MRFASTALLTALCAAGIAAAADPLPKAEAIIEKYIAATGGRAAAEKLHSQVLTGTIEMVGKGVTGTVMVYRAAPNKALSIVEFGGLGKAEEGTDGQVAWTRSAIAGPRVKEGSEKAFSLRGAVFNGDLRWRELYDKAEVVGLETVDGRSCYKVVMTPKGEGETVTRYYDKESGLVTKVLMTLKSPQGEIPIESIPSDYRKSGDLLLPHKLTQRVMGNEIVTTFTSVQNNPELAADRFALPPDIKALLEKKQK
ncbi:MAG TPA: hypothetical protein VN442_09470 [Bryobacteraceae bacterium]|nr:hypothetical protein [Bryobacteraceae bacterium]